MNRNTYKRKELVLWQHTFVYIKRKEILMISDKNIIHNEINIDKVFVYGTLMKDFWNYKRYLEGRINRITLGRTYGLLYHLPEGYPALLKGNEIIEGEIMEPVDEKLLKSLDRLEGYSKWRNDNLYVRELRKISTEDGNETACWIYIYVNEGYAREKGILVPNGNWRKFIENRRKL